MSIPEVLAPATRARVPTRARPIRDERHRHHGSRRRVEKVDERPAGDHMLVTCAVLEADVGDSRRPLVVFGGDLGSFAT